MKIYRTWTGRTHVMIDHGVFGFYYSLCGKKNTRRVEDGTLDDVDCKECIKTYKKRNGL